MLLKTLGLSPPARGVPGNPPGRGGPTGPLRRPGDLPREEIRGTPQKRQLTNEQFDELYKRLPANPRQRAEALAELGTRIGDEARKHEVVRGLRDLIAKVQPFMSKADAKKKLDEALDELFSKGIKKGVMEILEQAFGEAPERPMDGDSARKAPGEHIVDGPEFDSPFDKPKPVQRFCVPLRGRALPRAAVEVLQAQAARADGLQARRQEVRRHPRGLPVAGRQHHESRSPPFVIDKRIVDRGDKQGLQSMDLRPRTRPASTCCSSTALRPSRNRSRTLRSASSRAVSNVRLRQRSLNRRPSGRRP